MPFRACQKSGARARAFCARKRDMEFTHQTNKSVLWLHHFWKCTGWIHGWHKIFCSQKHKQTRIRCDKTKAKKPEQNIIGKGDKASQRMLDIRHFSHVCNSIHEHVAHTMDAYNHFLCELSAEGRDFDKCVLQEVLILSIHLIQRMWAALIGRMHNICRSLHWNGNIITPSIHHRRMPNATMRMMPHHLLSQSSTGWTNKYRVQNIFPLAPTKMQKGCAALCICAVNVPPSATRTLNTPSHLLGSPTMARCHRWLTSLRKPMKRPHSGWPNPPFIFESWLLTRCTASAHQQSHYKLDIKFAQHITYCLNVCNSMSCFTYVFPFRFKQHVI